ncbi:MAG: amino acid transporter [Anaerolineae bacterium]|nr:amino acid transporter [Anaerolineae bacterium]
MADVITRPSRPRHGWQRWLLGDYAERMAGPGTTAKHHPTHPWWQVMCLTGVDYFSTLGYQPGIAALAAGSLAPIATLILILLTLFGALPIYRHVAVESPHGEGSIAMLEHLLPWWQGKLFVLILLGFVATDFIITITLSAADATAHIVENPFVPAFLHDHPIPVTLILVGLLTAIFLKGFKEAIGVAVALVLAYLALNLVVVGVGLYEMVTHPTVLANWRQNLFTEHGNPLLMLGMALILFPKLALGLSGFETGVAVMPLVKGNADDTEEKPTGRIHNTHQLLRTAALIMSVYLIASSLITTTLIPPAEFQPGGLASGRALAYLAHTYLGDLFGTAYDISTILILWFAGASAMAGLLNIVPRYLPRYGMAPDWTRATRPLVLVFALIGFGVTLLFRANVEAQGGAYATGVLVLMSSGAAAVTLSAWRRGQKQGATIFGIITAVFIYTTLVNIVERPDGIRIASFFIGLIIVTSFISRVWRSTELRHESVELDPTAERFLQDASRGPLRFIANHLNAGDVAEYSEKEREVRADTHLPASEPVLFLEVEVCDPSEFEDVLEVKGVEVTGYRILRAESTSVANAIATFLLYVRDRTGQVPHVYFEWGEENPLKHLGRFLIFGEGDIPPVTREVLRKAEEDAERRPVVHVGG